MIRLPFRGFFNKISGRKKPAVLIAIPPMKKEMDDIIIDPKKLWPKFVEDIKRPSVLASWLGIGKSDRRNITPQGKELMLQLAEEKRERRRQRNLQIARGIQWITGKAI